MYCLDVDNDGDKEVISSSAHDYGIWWYEQLADPSNALTWQKHTISNSAVSYTHLDVYKRQTVLCILQIPKRVKSGG